MKDRITDQSIIDRFLNNTVPPENPEECWPWIGAINSGGYGNFNCKGVTEKAHRISYRIFCGSIKDSNVIMHTCDNRRCVNPKHLIEGTQQENVLDMISKDRAKQSHIGNKNGRAILSKQDIPRILEYIEQGYTHKAISIIFKVDRSTITSVINKRNWNIGD